LGLEGRFLEELGFLVRIELLLGNKVVDGDAGVVRDDTVGFRSGGDLLVEVTNVSGGV
jgi:hypothetical protein